MPFNKEITIQPHDLQKIMDNLSAYSHVQGPLIIRDTGNDFVVRDSNEGYITSVEKTFCEKPG